MRGAGRTGSCVSETNAAQYVLFYFFASVRVRGEVIPLKWILTMLFGNRSADLAKSDPDDDLYEDFNYRCVVLSILFCSCARNSSSHPPKIQA